MTESSGSEGMAIQIKSLREELNRLRDERDQARKRAESEERLKQYFSDLAKKYEERLYDDTNFVLRKELHFWQWLVVATAGVAVIFAGIAFI